MDYSSLLGGRQQVDRSLCASSRRRDRYRVECSEQSNTDFTGKAEILHVVRYTGNNLLRKHGFLRVSADQRHFEYADATAFFWLGDTWWKGLCKRLSWEGF